MFYDRTKFFGSVRSSLTKNGKLSQDQVDGFEILLKEGEKRLVNTEWIAYVLATAWHETAFTMQPVRETLAKDDRTAKARLDKAWASGKLGQVSTPYWRDGFFGRGYVQLTFEYNYKKMGDWLGIDLVKNPGLALDPATAARIIYEGMLRGMFTAKKLSDYLDGVDEVDAEDFAEYQKARRVVNGTDKAKEIANYAVAFERALRASEVVMVTDAPKVVVSTKPPVKPAAPAEAIVPPKPPNKKEKTAMKSTTIWASIGGFFMSVLGFLGGLPTPVQILLLLLIAGAVFWVIRERLKGNDPIEKIL